MKRLFTAGLFLLLCLTLPVARAADNQYSRRSLRGLGAVYVVVEDLDADATETGLTVADLQTDVELRLRQAGVKVVDNGTASHLYVNVQMMPWRWANHTPANGISMALQLELDQSVTLARDPSIWLPSAATWSVSMLAVSPPSNARHDCRDRVKDLVDMFLNAYLEQNPKQ
jgi:hypothetical protein